MAKRVWLAIVLFFVVVAWALIIASLSLSSWIEGTEDKVIRPRKLAVGLFQECITFQGNEDCFSVLPQDMASLWQGAACFIIAGLSLVLVSIILMIKALCRNRPTWWGKTSLRFGTLLIAIGAVFIPGGFAGLDDACEGDNRSQCGLRCQSTSEEFSAFELCDPFDAGAGIFIGLAGVVLLCLMNLLSWCCLCCRPVAGIWFGSGSMLSGALAVDVTLQPHVLDPFIYVSAIMGGLVFVNSAFLSPAEPPNVTNDYHNVVTATEGLTASFCVACILISIALKAEYKRLFFTHTAQPSLTQTRTTANKFEQDPNKMLASQSLQYEIDNPKLLLLIRKLSAPWLAAALFFLCGLLCFIVTVLLSLRLKYGQNWGFWTANWVGFSVVGFSFIVAFRVLLHSREHNRVLHPDVYSPPITDAAPVWESRLELHSAISPLESVKSDKYVLHN
eukprot:m.270252 g.270252  ORF g.270252 m.270252 type:complete len:446 (+) comp46282_c0_seq1:74-1411(+)